ncbi:MAG TPA: alpha/beta fold hydrolase [Acidimicrobiales bacterium]|nr:alpha/beta fold hydrolase [Acidimicrobiales bacterium]
MTTFALIHGACHGAWCWDLLVPELEAGGASAITMDLPVEDPQAGIEEYAATVLAALDGAPGDLCIVGHSMGGLVAPVVAERRACRRLVLLAAPIPEPGNVMLEPAYDERYLAASTLGPDGCVRFPREAAMEWFYHDCSPEIAGWAAGLLRPQGVRSRDDPSPLQSWPQVPLSYVLCAEDRIIDPAWVRSVVAERFGLVAHELGAGHSPFLSRPAELAELLLGL